MYFLNKMRRLSEAILGEPHSAYVECFHMNIIYEKIK